MQLCIYAGTFNPIHMAHLTMAQIVKDDLGVDKVIFIPAFNPPHRENGVISPEHRFNMVKLATLENESFDVSDIEFKMEGKSYTYNTIKKLYELYPGIEGKINFIIGTDSFEKIDSWYEAKKFAELVNFAIVPRGENFDFNAMLENIELKNFDYRIINAPFIDISSTFIRERISNNKSIKYLVTSRVEEYIFKNNLFKC